MNQIQMAQLNAWITDTYGSPAILAHYLDLAVEMLFYLEKDSFEQMEIQNVVTALKGMERVMRKIPG
ncbi:MAG: hypothetical protein NXH86_06670 [Flavobacteriaceae bacterium]|uniref:hypothetical protein n=1 Tax=Flagellimonas sp. SN16 TaxID=3415142 RepID=UPI0025EF1BA5|nr:hypothetical protein [Allomuricauda sp.]MCR9263823.1 hypothetical protein [Flavobacteriaceae bacterium]